MSSPHPPPTLTPPPVQSDELDCTYIERSNGLKVSALREFIRQLNLPDDQRSPQLRGMPPDDRVWALGMRSYQETIDNVRALKAQFSMYDERAAPLALLTARENFQKHALVLDQMVGFGGLGVWGFVCGEGGGARGWE